MMLGQMTLNVIVRSPDGQFEAHVGTVGVPLHLNLQGYDGTEFVEAVEGTNDTRGEGTDASSGTGPQPD